VCGSSEISQSHFLVHALNGP